MIAQGLILPATPCALFVPSALFPHKVLPLKSDLVHPGSPLPVRSVPTRPSPRTGPTQIHCPRADPSPIPPPDNIAQQADNLEDTRTILRIVRGFSPDNFLQRPPNALDTRMLRDVVRGTTTRGCGRAATRDDDDGAGDGAGGAGQGQGGGRSGARPRSRWSRAGDGTLLAVDFVEAVDSGVKV